MPALRMIVRRTPLLLALLLFCVQMRSDVSSHSYRARLAVMPKRTLWVWERPEDMHSIDPQSTAIAYLDQTILLERTAESRRRVQPFSYPAGSVLIPVVRLEAPPGAVLDAYAEQAVVAFLLHSASRPGVVALQVDFDATRSQRAFYRDVLWRLRAQMPAEMPLSITALASWCSYDDWIGSLPVDEAVPMFFRMEPDRRRAWAGLPVFKIREPLCMNSVGVSTHESWPQAMAGKRIYIFPDLGWRSDFAVLEQRKLP